jgi:hypothetical protein
MLPRLWRRRRRPVTVDVGHVLVGDATPRSWRVSTIGDPHMHPVSGNREFGVYRDEDGAIVFYTRGADRPTRWTDWRLEDLVFERADILWRTLVRKVIAWVNHFGGAAELGSIGAARLKWAAVQDSYFHRALQREAEAAFTGPRRIHDPLASLASLAGQMAHVRGVAVTRPPRRRLSRESDES